MYEVLVLGVNLFTVLLNLLMVWINIKLMTENAKHRLLEK